MTRDVLTLEIDDLSAFARRLRAELTGASALPSHLEMLGHLARAAGYRNYQHLRTLRGAAEPPPVPDRRKVEAALRIFDARGRMIRWPGRTAQQGLCLWALWARLPAREEMTEAQVNAVLQDGNTFGDHVQLRRGLIEHGLATRDPDGRRYRRVEAGPPPEARALIRVLAPRLAALAEPD